MTRDRVECGSSEPCSRQAAPGPGELLGAPAARPAPGIKLGVISADTQVVSCSEERVPSRSDEPRNR